VNENEIMWFLDRIDPVYTEPTLPNRIHTIYDELKWVRNELKILEEIRRSDPPIKEPDWDNVSDKQKSWSIWYKYTVERKDSISNHMCELINEERKIKFIIELRAEKKGLKLEFYKLKAYKSSSPHDNQLVAEQMSILDSRMCQLNEAVEQIKTYDSKYGFKYMNIDYGGYSVLKGHWEAVGAVQVTINDTALPNLDKRCNPDNNNVDKTQ